MNAKERALLVSLTPPAHWGDTCVAWVQSKGRTCGAARVDGEYVCQRHYMTAKRRADRETMKVAKQNAKRLDKTKHQLPKMRAELAHLRAQIDAETPREMTTDLAAYGGVGSTAARRFHAQHTPERIYRLAVLTDKAMRIEENIRAAEKLLRNERA